MGRTGRIGGGLAAVALALTTIISTAAADGDTRPPRAPAWVDASVPGDRTIEVTWARATDDVGVVGYRILRNGTEIKRTGPELRAVLEGLPGGVSFLQLQAFDAAGNESVRTRPLPVVVDTLRPSAPTVTVEIVPADRAAGTPAVYRFGPFGGDDVSRVVEFRMLVNGRPFATFDEGPVEQFRSIPPVVPVEDLEPGSRWIQFQSVDGFGNVSVRSRPLRIEVPDLDRLPGPAPLRNVALRPVGDEFEVTWSTSIVELAAVEVRDGDAVLARADASAGTLTFGPTRPGAIAYSVVGIDEYGREVAASPIDVDVAPRSGPFAPQHVQFEELFNTPYIAGIQPGGRVTWTPSSDGDGDPVAAYEILINGNPVLEVPPTQTSAELLRSVLPPFGFEVAVRAVDTSGASATSGPIDASVFRRGVFPEEPSGVVVAVDGSTVHFRWTTPFGGPLDATSAARYRLIGDAIPNSSGYTVGDLFLPDDFGTTRTTANGTVVVEPFGNSFTLRDVPPGFYVMQLDMRAVDGSGPMFLDGAFVFTVR